MNECRTEHYTMFQNPISVDPDLEIAPWEIRACSHFENLQLSLMVVATTFQKAEAEAFSYGVIRGGIEDNSPQWLLTLWDVKTNNNISKWFTSLTEARTMYGVWEHWMITNAEVSEPASR